MRQIQIKRAYEAAATNDGVRVLVDRLWPRGLKREDADIDHWLKEVAPSTGLRRWFGHDPSRWPEFAQRYRAELAANPPDLAILRGLLQGSGRLTLLFAAADTERNNAVVLHDVLLHGSGEETG